MEKVSKYEISPLIALLNMIKVNYFGKTEIYKTLLAVLCDHDTRNPAIKEKTKHYIQLLLADHQDLARSLISFLPGEANADSIPLGLSPITNTPAGNLKRHKKSRHKSKKKTKQKSKQSSIVNRVLLETLPPDLATPPKQSAKMVVDFPDGTPKKENKSITPKISETLTPKTESDSPRPSLPEEVCNTKNISSRCNSDSEIIRSKSPVFSTSSRKPVVFTTAVYNENKSYPLPFSMFDSCGFPLKNLPGVCETGQKFSPRVSHRQASVSVADTGTLMTKKSISQQCMAEAKTSEVPSLTSAIPTKPGNSCGLPLAIPPYQSTSRMMPLYNRSRNAFNVGDQANYSTTSLEQNMNSGLEHLPFCNTSESAVHGTEPTVLIPATLPHKASLSQMSGLPHNFIHRPEPLLIGHTPKVYNPVQWATKFEQFSTMTVGRTFHNSPAGHLQPPPVAKLPCSTGLASHNPPVPHLYTLPKTSASFVPSQVEQHLSQLSLTKSPLHYSMAQTSHSAGKKIYLGTNSNLSAFPYTRQMVLPDGQTQNLYLKRSSVNIPADSNGMSDIENLQKGMATGASYSYPDEQGNISFPNQNVIDMNTGVPMTVPVESSMLQQLGDTRQSLKAPVPFFISDHHLSKLQHPDNMVDSLGGRGDADILETLPKPKKVIMSANSSVRKKLRLTPKSSIHQENAASYDT
ncbi:uncharacterized protein LOC117334105 [Pecten maximus]|uniref:uncharacterized protein LOC117334105 n=1 Tax=Pecten maximus TaxID=6579 RepID=UPI001458219B|nr:uncharacterized protein LOC117334105 [Pecten maximus]